VAAAGAIVVTVAADTLITPGIQLAGTKVTAMLLVADGIQPPPSAAVIDVVLLAGGLVVGRGVDPVGVVTDAAVKIASIRHRLGSAMTSLSSPSTFIRRHTLP
jgi:hypothetical protein